MVCLPKLHRDTHFKWVSLRRFGRHIKMNMTWCAVSAANREEATFDCDASSMPDAKRLCFCAPAE